MELEYIKANNVYYKPQKEGVQDPDKIKGCFYSVCIIKKRWFGLWQIDYHQEWSDGDENIPNRRLILFPSRIEEIRYKLNK